MFGNALLADEPAVPVPGRDTLNTFLNEITQYTAEFNQTLFDEYGEILEESTGRVALSKPGKFYWEYVDPYRQQIVSNGQFLWIYDQDLEQVTVNQVAASADSPLALLVNGVQIEQSYTVEPVAHDDALRWLALTPKQADSEYQRVEIGVNDSDVVRMRLHDNLNQLTELEFINADKAAQIDAQQFEFKVPAGVDLVNGLAE